MNISITWILIALLCVSISLGKKKNRKAKKCECGIIRHSRRNIFYRVIGGTAVDPPNKYPWMVSIAVYGRHNCGGAIISEYYVLTAAHCVVKQSCFRNSAKWADCYVNPSEVEVVYFDNNLSRRIAVDFIRSHNKYTVKTISYDITLLKLKKKIPCNSYTSPVCLPTLPNIDASGTVGTVAGWGRTTTDLGYFNKANILRETTMKIHDDEASCGERITHIRTHFCAISKGHGTCQGDSGGPIFTNWKGHSYVIGIMSFGTQEDCSINTREFFTRVSAVLPWIKKETGLLL